MKSAVFCALAGTAIMLTTTVDGHGQMLVLAYRHITAKYRADCLFGLKGSGDDELEWAPIELLSQRTVYEPENNVTKLEAGKKFDVKYFVQAPHPGYMKLSIVKPRTDSIGKITTYKRDTQIGYFSNFATSGGTFTVSTTIPTTVTGCENAGDCALQFFWHSDVANQTYPTCADIIIPGSGAVGSFKTSISTSTTATKSSTKTTVNSEVGNEASDAAATTQASSDDDTATSTTDESSAGTTTAPSTSTTSDKCLRRK
ncbi:Lytic polysaccharide mono-oxygenase [Phytophthora infestans]|uniref:Lytic polysaccharide mono-oxygenase n=1 Tax=Phytophthora infestans TaxID=4787 RepID=A0A833T9D8_PHYIN|nr:Lytic polysaccharide mono-oxygenase [Phytophthora infestans]KAF4131996.1 Lytic polysaccharide mono-oxygenase [Phytophthora infestans]